MLTATLLIELFVLVLLVAVGYVYSEFVNERGRLPERAELRRYAKASNRVQRNIRAILFLSVIFLFLALVALLGHARKLQIPATGWREWAKTLLSPAILILLVPVVSLRISSGILRMGDLVRSTSNAPIVSVGRLIFSGGWSPKNLGVLRNRLVVFQLLLLMTIVFRSLLTFMGE